MSPRIDKVKKEFPYYWICVSCATDRGGKWPKGHVATVVLKKCQYCKGKNHSKDECIAPFVDYDWPNHDFSKCRD